MLTLNWPLVFLTTILLYILIIVTLPFNAVYATIFLFGLIAFWSRLPGTGIPAPFFLLYNSDMVDMFSLIIAINLSGLKAALFIIFCNMVSRACGTTPEWGAVISDTISMSLAIMIIPFLHAATGSDILFSMIIYTAIRALLWIPFDFIFYPNPLPKYIIEFIIGGGSLFLFNIFYTKLFGGFLNSLMNSGVSFSWVLFIVATVVIFSFYAIVFPSSKNASIKPLLNSLTRRMVRGVNKATKTTRLQNKEKDIDDIARIRKYL